MSVIQVQFDGSDILFFNWNHDESLLVRKLEAALGVNAKKRRFLVFVERIEFIIEQEIVPLFVDEDGSAHIEMRKNSAVVKEKVTTLIRQSGHFREG